jgi:hypothetical protein
MEEDKLRQLIKECIEEVFFSEDEFSPFNALQDKINKLIDVNEYEKSMKCSIEMFD